MVDGAFRIGLLIAVRYAFSFLPGQAAHQVWNCLSCDAEHPKSIRLYRQEERRQAADRKRTRRASRRVPKT